MSPMVIKIVAVVILLVAIVVTALLTKTISIKRYQESENQKLNNAEDKARQIIDEAVKTAETKKQRSPIRGRRKKRSRIRMKLSVNPKSVEPKFSDMKSEYYRKRKLWTKNRKP